ncbi:MAG: protein rep [Firmicutes bacterium]|nr:protein rep [Bacillota bacterium]
MDKSQEENILKDLDSRRKPKDWSGKKIASLKLAKIYGNIGEKIKSEYKLRGVRVRTITTKDGRNISIGLYDRTGKRVVNYEKRAKNMRFCGSYLDFINVDDRLKLIKANFCRVPLCPMCQWRKSLRVFVDTSRVIDEVEKQHKELKHIFLTLTVKNCSLDDLSKTLDSFFKGWDNFIHSRTLRPKVKGEIRCIIKGWFRALEIEYNSETNQFHPHFHAILNVDKNYFKGTDYLETKEWVQLWRESAKLDYDPICDIRRIKHKGNRKDIMEVAKYTYKDAVILSDMLSDGIKDEVVKYLSNALHQRRLYAYGGVMKEIAAELKIKDIDKADLIKVDDEKIDYSLAKMILSYRWNMGLSNYILVGEKENKNEET